MGALSVNFRVLVVDLSGVNESNMSGYAMFSQDTCYLNQYIKTFRLKIIITEYCHYFSQGPIVSKPMYDFNNFKDLKSQILPVPE